MFADDVITETRKSDSFSGNDYTTVDAGTHETARDVGGPTAFSPPFTGTPTPLAAVGPISSGEITAQNARAESAFLPAVEPTSNPDPTKPTKLDPGFVHLVPGTLVDAYEIEKLLGAGGMGAVYGAHHEKLRRRVAVKVISPALSRDRDAIERFEQEAHALARLSHPNVVAVLSVGTLPGDGRAYYVMEWLEGAPLRDSLDHGRVPIEDSIDVLDQIARGLEAAHGSGIVHRDLKPDNIWLQRVGDEPQPLVKILDFGLAKLREHRRTEETAVGIMFGTPQYMSPEQCQSARDVGPATDIYALGCIAYEMLCGRLPFLQDNAAELIVAHQMETPPRPRDLNPDVAGVLDELVYAMLSKEPAQRPTLPAVRSAMMRARQRSSAQSQQSTSPRVAAVRSLRARRLQRALFGVGCVVLIALIAFAVTLAARGSADGRDARAHVEPVDAAINVVGPIDSAVAPVVVMKLCKQFRSMQVCLPDGLRRQPGPRRFRQTSRVYR